MLRGRYGWFLYMVQAQEVFLILTSAISGFASIFLILRHNATQAGTDTVTSLIADNRALQSILESHKKREAESREDLQKLYREVGEIKGLIRTHTEITPASRAKIERKLADVTNYLLERQENII